MKHERWSFWEYSKHFKTVNYFGKRSILDISLGSKHASQISDMLLLRAF